MEIFNLICDIIIVVGGVITAIFSILKFMGKPIGFMKKRIELQRKADKEALIREVTDSIKKELEPDLIEIKEQNASFQNTINILITTTKDLLRKSILNIYNENKHSRQLNETTKEVLDDLYKDYRAENGNSYIEKIYSRMCHWEIVPDEE